MSKADFVTRLSAVLRPDPARMVIRPYTPSDPQKFEDADHPRAQRIADRVLALDETSLQEELQRLLLDFSNRHRDVTKVFLRRFEEVNGLMICPCEVSRDRALLIGSYFCNEYTYEAAALFNPSIVPHPNQSGVPTDSTRFVLSLRGVGEGHISSVTFRTGVCGADGAISIDQPSPKPLVLQTETIDCEGTSETGVRMFCDGSHDLSEVVIFPTTPSQRNGIEDMRLVRFLEEDGKATYFGTYTAFSGQAIRQELLRTPDFRTFDLLPLRGDATESKGMALFPRRIDGKYAMIGRQDNENIWFLTSDDIYEWNGGVKIAGPRWPWEFVQMGNCGSPIEIDEGWLVMTHGVGTVRNYCIGACLLDKNDPSKLLARTPRPVLAPSPHERDGYVPNVVYSCGVIVHDRTMLLPYGVADSFTAFATASIDNLLSVME